MKSTLIRGLRVMVLSAFLVGVIAPGSGSVRMPVHAGGNNADGFDIHVSFRGLMVFDNEIRGGTQTIWLYSQARHHKVTIRVNGPTFGGEFLDWSHSYAVDDNLKLEVTNVDPTVPVTSPTFSDLPYKIANLYPESEGDGRLIMLDPSPFGPTLTINKGEFRSDDKTTIRFISDTLTKPDVPGVARLVEALIHVSSTERAFLRGDGQPTLEITPPGPWYVEVRNNPDIASACSDDHFKSYYDGFYLQRAGQSPVPVYRTRKYKATSPGAAPCLDHKLDKNRVIPTHPCIPVSP